ncbi:MAG: 1-acyl-sn-glycerol-3-phosphate acyltransferase [Treponema sp.]|nr:1-acyl-sn-glycerol-3-phosphate acyltransferase [Treponema sp.]MCL2237952.1 1-acyl-sn-glycerol-3-phosphate acyltransferase [Treponema sp.]
MKNKKKDIKLASNLIFDILRIILVPILWRKYRFRFEYHTSKGITRPCIILSNHQTSFDQFVVGSGFRFAMNFFASDSIFRHGLLSKLMIFLAQPIPFSKGSTDASAIIKMFSVLKQGGSVGIFVSGSRSFFGEECTLKPGIGKLVKKTGVPVVLVKMRGGYNTKPRWKSKPNKGDMRAGVSRVISPEELSAFSSEQLDEIIMKELYFNEFEWNAAEQIVFKGKHKAEFLERALFYCPECKSLESLGSKGNEFFCNKCEMRVIINGTGFFEKINNAGTCPDTILEWSRMQLEHIKSLDFCKYADKPLFSDSGVRLSSVIRSKKDVTIGKGSVELYSDRLRICGKDFLIENFKDMSIQSYNRLMIYMTDGEYTLDMALKGNAVKYMICSYHLKNLMQNTENGHYGY